MGRSSGNDLLVAASRHGEPLFLTREQRSRHLYVTGLTGRALDISPDVQGAQAYEKLADEIANLVYK